jgi:hypothetical protein
MKISSKKLRILIACCIGIIIPIFQFVLQRKHHLRLKETGVIAKTVSAYRQAWGNSYVDFSFPAPNGK